MLSCAPQVVHNNPSEPCTTLLLWSLSSPVIPHTPQVVYNNLRPEFPRGMDPQYKELAHRCWAADPGDRPTSDQVCMGRGWGERRAEAQRRVGVWEQGMVKVGSDI
jgi:hypothetical protein